MPRRRSSPMRRPSPERSQVRSRSPPQTSPATRPQQSQVGAPAQQGPGLMGQAAATMGGAMVGSVIGHGVSNMLFGGGSKESQPDVTYQESPPQPQYNNPQQNVCSYELQQFLNCAQTQSDVGLCEGFNEALKQCKRNNIST